jgi:hypothetical protein
MAKRRYRTAWLVRTPFKPELEGRFKGYSRGTAGDSAGDSAGTGKGTVVKGVYWGGVVGSGAVYQDADGDQENRERGQRPLERLANERHAYSVCVCVCVCLCPRARVRPIHRFIRSLAGRSSVCARTLTRPCVHVCVCVCVCVCVEVHPH